MNRQDTTDEKDTINRRGPSRRTLRTAGTSVALYVDEADRFHAELLTFIS
jgi:hypothetical protein